MHRSIVVLDDGETYGSVIGAKVAIPTKAQLEALESGNRKAKDLKLKFVAMEDLIEAYHHTHTKSPFK